MKEKLTVPVRKSYLIFTHKGRTITLAAVRIEQGIGHDYVAVGISICALGDTYNEKFGKTIAYGRAKTLETGRNNWIYNEYCVRHTFSNYTNLLKEMKETILLNFTKYVPSATIKKKK